MTHNLHHKLPVAVPPANRFTILVVDDETLLRSMICRTLDRIGYVTVDVENPVEAIDLLKSGMLQPDLILSDVEMPEMTGIEMVRKIRLLESSVSSLPIIVASGNPSPEMRRQAIDAGADCFMTKPFDLGDLYTEVGNLLRKTQNSGRTDAGCPGGSRHIAANRLSIEPESKETV